MTDPSHPSPRAEVLQLLAGERPRRVPCFSGLINVTEPGLAGLGLRLPDVHADAGRLAAAAASTYRLCGFESAVLPLDLCVEAEALGAELDFGHGAAQRYLPRVKTPLAGSVEALDLSRAPDLERLGRAPVVFEALARLKEQVGSEIVVGACVPGPFTLLSLVVEPDNLYGGLRPKAPALQQALGTLAEALARVAQAYRLAGADFITVHEMGGSPGVIGPARFEALVLPALQQMLAALPAPRVLSVCGRTNRAMPLLAQAGAEALSVDQQNDLAASRATLGPEALLFGNLDPVGVLAQGDAAAVRGAVQAAVAAGVDAVWPGCDLWPAVPVENLRAMVEAAGAKD